MAANSASRAAAVAALALLAGSAHALVDAEADPGAVLNARVDAEYRAPRAEETLRLQEARQEAARLRAAKIRHLPPEKVRAWAAGSLTEEDLERLAELPTEGEEAAPDEALAATLTRGRASRLAAAALLAAGLAGLVWRRRRQERLAEALALRSRRPAR